MPEFIRIEDNLKDAILTIIKYVHVATGVEPTQNEIAEMLKSYFILNEIGNQVKYQLKKASNKENDEEKIHTREPFWTLNLMTGPSRNVLARAGFFSGNIQAAIDSIREYIKKITGADPTSDTIARSLRSSFILSEIKNHIEWQRKKAKKSAGSDKERLT